MSTPIGDASPAAPPPLPPIPTSSALGSSGTDPVPIAPASPAPKTGRRPARGVLAIAVVVIIAIGILAFSGVFSTAAGSPSGTGIPYTFGQTASSGESTAMNTSGGPWTVVSAEGIGIPTNISGPNFESIEPGCTYTPAPGSTGTVTFAGTPSNASVGALATWVYIATNPSGQMLFVVSVGDAAAAAVIGSGTCTSLFLNFGAIAGLSLVDSPMIASSANAEGGSAFLQAHPGATVGMVLLGPSSTTSNDAIWGVEYSTCSFTATAGQGTEFIALFYAGSGSAYTPATTEPISC